MKNSKAGFIGILLTIMIGLAVLGGAGYAVYTNSHSEEKVNINNHFDEIGQPPCCKETPIPGSGNYSSGSNLTSTATAPSVLPIGDASGWKTYVTQKYGFQFQYPSNLNVIDLGPNDVEEKMEKGEEVSGTVPAVLDDLSFRDQKGVEVFSIRILPISNYNLTPKEYFDGYLSIGSACDTRWLTKVPESKSVQTVSNNGLHYLKVTGAYWESGPFSCYFLKNSSHNLIILNTSDHNFSNDLIDRLLPTFKFSN